jgi:hypothetical protein
MISFVATPPPPLPVARSRRWVLHGALPLGRVSVSLHGQWRTLTDSAIVLRDRGLGARYQWCAVSTFGVRWLVGGRFR